MIKIIKEGKKPIKTKRVYKTTCPQCGCEFEFEEEDCINFTHYKGLEHKAPLITVQCPCCKGSICGDEDTPIFTYEDRPVEEKPYDIMTDDDTWKRHPEYEPIFKKHDDYDYYDVHVDKYDLSKHINWSPYTNLPDDISDYISRVNSIDNYKLPDDYKVEGFEKKQQDDAVSEAIAEALGIHDYIYVKGSK